jgi:hypothetical protein
MKRKTNGNTQRSNARLGFHVSRKPVVHVTAEDRLDNGDDTAGLPHVYGPPILFAIASDSRTIFASWNIDWAAVFQEGAPVDKQVHLRIYRADGIEEKSSAVEPMATMHYVRADAPGASYHLEIGYYQPADAWHSVAVSNEVTLPPNGIAETEEVELVTIPFHLSFQHLVELLKPPTRTALAVVVSQFEKHVLGSDEPQSLRPKHRAILRKLGLSASDIAAARLGFDQTDGQKLARRTGELLGLGATSPSRGFADSSWSSALNASLR